MAGDRLLTSRKDVWGTLKEASRTLRNTQTHAEDVLWERLRNRRAGPKFRRQHAIDQFVADFYCPGAKLVVEVDGAIHEHQVSRDVARDQRLAALGFLVLRFANERVLGQADAVVAEIVATVERRQSGDER